MHSVLKCFELFSDLAAESPIKESFTRLLASGSYKELSLLSCHPSDYQDPYRYLSDAQLCALVRKLSGLSDDGLRQAAVNEFTASEDACRASNARLAPWVNARERGLVSESPTDHWFYSRISSIRKRIGDVLGPVPQDLEPRFGNGATFGDKGRLITIAHKMASQPTVTERALPYFRLWVNTHWWKATDTAPLVVPGNRFTTVAKDSKKDRGIAVEPSVNVALQLAVGAILKERLTRIGINIGRGGDEAQMLHRRLACEASITGDLATIDLSSASDTISYNLVKLLLPAQWFTLLSDLRSPKTLIDGTWHTNAKFSSMGNGFTFELETLLFWAIAHEVDEGFETKVYGDDILVRSCNYEDVVPLLNYFGFKVNTDKSFHTGPFRESCGGDFWNGADVRPVFIKTVPSRPEEWIVFHNLMRRACLRLGPLSQTAQGVLQSAIHNIPKRFRKFGPVCDHDSWLHTDERDRWDLKVRDCCLFVRGVVPLPKRQSLDVFTPSVALAAALLGAPSQGPSMRGITLRLRRVWLSIS